MIDSEAEVKEIRILEWQLICLQVIHVNAQIVDKGL